MHILELDMKRRAVQPKSSGISLIEILALIAIFLIITASIQIVSNGRAKRNSLHRDHSITNQIAREFRAVHGPINAHAPQP